LSCDTCSCTTFAKRGLADARTYLTGIKPKVIANLFSLPDLLGDLLTMQARVVDECARVSPFDRLSPGRRTRLLQLAALVLLLTIGLVIRLTIAWAVIAIPMAVIVLLFLVELEEVRLHSSAITRP
jgi:hypothetical protein